MDKDAIVAALQAQAPALKARGIRSLSLFGSAARGELRAGSDVDVLIDLDERHNLSLVQLEGIRDHLGGVVSAPVDLVVRRNLKPFLRTAILRDCIQVF